MSPLWTSKKSSEKERHQHSHWHTAVQCQSVGPRLTQYTRWRLTFLLRDVTFFHVLSSVLPREDGGSVSCSLTDLMRETQSSARVCTPGHCQSCPPLHTLCRCHFLDPPRSCLQSASREEPRLTSGPQISSRLLSGGESWAWRGHCG